MMKKFLNVIFLMVAVLFLAGCQSSDLGVEKSSKEEFLASRLQSPLTGSEMSFKVKNYLTEEALEEEYVKNPEKVLKRLDKKFKKTKDKHILLALIELTYAQGQKASGVEALSFFLSSAVYSATFFDTAQIPDPTPFSPIFIYVCRCYNYSIAEILKIMQQEKLSLLKKHDIPILQGMMTIEPSKSSLPYPLAKYHKFLNCSGYVPYGFLTSSRSFGMGVPVIAIQKETELVTQEHVKGHVYTIANSPAPATAFFRIKSTKPGQYQGKMEFYNPYKEDSFTMEGQKVPLEIDITTPFAYMSRGGARYSGFSALANPKYMHLPEGLFLMTPYDKDKIPLVIVHGLMSRPRTWSQMINTILNNKKIREKYQIWFFAYPTGFPVLDSAHKLRTALREAQNFFDPKKNNPNFNKMVIVGHSMGGMLTRNMVQTPGDKLVKLLFNKPIDKMKIPQEDKDFLKNALIFEPLPFVKRVIFMSTPHRGSEMTHWTTMRLAVKFINLPKSFAGKMKDIGDNVKIKTGIIEGSSKTIKDLQGVDSLDPDNKVMQLLAEQKILVKYHTICGNEIEAGVIGGTDGIVSYESAHLDGSESELVIKSTHNSQKHPAGIKEVRRILLKHLEESK
jgi:pimeloyl-ACP methyl ester carboxylesterase